jgi:serine/threonine protein kinase
VADEVIEGYRLTKHMATGQSSQVWEVVELSSHRHFAMKLLLPEKAQVAEYRRTLFHEAEVAQKLTHENIIRIVRVIRDPKIPNFVMEFFPAGSLKARVVARDPKSIQFLREKLDDLLRQAATALAFTNAKGWVHRDVKPDNFLANSAGNLRLIDFALATRITKGGGLFSKLFGRKQRTMGTRSYMSPEQIFGKALDGRADVYSFGATCYELVTGRPPFRAATSDELLKKHIREKPVSPAVHNPDVTDEFAALVLRMLAKKREDRPKDFHEILMALRGLKVFKSDAPGGAA